MILPEFVVWGFLLISLCFGVCDWSKNPDLLCFFDLLFEPFVFLLIRRSEKAFSCFNLDCSTSSQITKLFGRPRTCKLDSKTIGSWYTHKCIVGTVIKYNHRSYSIWINISFLNNWWIITYYKLGIWNVCNASIKSSIKLELAWFCWLPLRKNDNSITLSFGSCDKSPKIVQCLSNKNLSRSILFCDPSNLVQLKLFISLCQLAP